mmetsp:Transcript_8160/g.17598  ORF Transcript_8160/g.17598 Transcript_8160/m.17598 type:complete len:280 (+) Transcript_8160:960-1799(+)
MVLFRGTDLADLHILFCQHRRGGYCRRAGLRNRERRIGRSHRFLQLLFVAQGGLPHVGNRPAGGRSIQRNHHNLHRAVHYGRFLEDPPPDEGPCRGHPAGRHYALRDRQHIFSKAFEQDDQLCECRAWIPVAVCAFTTDQIQLQRVNYGARQCFEGCGKNHVIWIRSDCVVHQCIDPESSRWRVFWGRGRIDGMVACQNGLDRRAGFDSDRVCMVELFLLVSSVDGSRPFAGRRYRANDGRLRRRRGGRQQRRQCRCLFRGERVNITQLLLAKANSAGQ